VTAILLALGASLTWGFADFGAGLGARRLPVSLVVAASQTAGLVLVALVVAAAGARIPSAPHLAWGAAAGVSGVLGLAAFYRALAVGTMGIVGPITATAAIVPLCYGLARGERPSPLQAAGLALAIVGVVGASREPAPARGTGRLAPGVGLALVAAAGFGCTLVGVGRAAGGGALWATLSMRAAGAPLAALAALALRPRPAAPPRAWLLLAAVGLGDTGATILYGLASTRGLLSVVSVLASLDPVVLIVLARILLAERPARAQLAGLCAALAGVALISAG
jgi:drug/metabolite transporter (DMT)-like permease